MLKKELQKRKKELANMLSTVNRGIDIAPEGHLRVVQRVNVAQYYVVTEKGDTLGRYIRASEAELAGQLAQKAYYEKIRRNICGQIKVLDSLIDKVESDNELGMVYEMLNDSRKQLVKPIAVTDDEYAKRWMAEPYKGKGFSDDYPEYYSNRGERVRSKSEESIANALYEMGIPYKYECPLLIDEKYWVYPDFTILLKRSRKVCYLEHFGRMDDVNYLKDEFFTKINSYSRNGLIQGVNFYMTFESKGNPFTSRDAKQCIRNILLADEM